MSFMFSLTIPNPEKKPDPNIKKIGLVWVVLGEIVGSSLVGLGVGYVAWAKLNFSVWALVLCPMLGLAIGFYQVYKITQREP